MIHQEFEALFHRSCSYTQDDSESCGATPCGMMRRLEHLGSICVRVTVVDINAVGCDIILACRVLKFPREGSTLQLALQMPTVYPSAVMSVMPKKETMP